MPAAEGMSGIWMDISGDMPGDHAEAMILKKRSLPNTGKVECLSAENSVAVSGKDGAVD